MSYFFKFQEEEAKEKEAEADDGEYNPMVRS